MNSIRICCSFLVLAALFLGISVANAQAVVDLPEFKSGASLMLGIPVDFSILNQRVSAIYDIVESDDSHVVWKFTGSTGDWAFVFADGRIVVASTVNFDLAMKDTLLKELNDVMDLLSIVNPGAISDSVENEALEGAIYYAEDSNIYHSIKHYFDSNFDFTLVVPECTIKDARLTVWGSDDKKYPNAGYLVSTEEAGQYYYIDDIEITSCYVKTGTCDVPVKDITNAIPTGLHNIKASSINNKHTMAIEIITSPMPPKDFILYGPNYQPWINETSESKDLEALRKIIAGNTNEMQRKETIKGEIIGRDLTNLPNVKLNVFVNVSNATTKTERLNAEDFTVNENSKKIPIDSFYFTGNATGQQLDLAVVFDNTTSMDDRIKALKSKVKDLTQKINSSNLSARYSLVTFSGAATNTEINWTDDAESYQKAVGRLSVSGGNIDLPENSLEGIERALSFGFRPNAQRVILVVTDEPSLQKGDGKSISLYSMEDVKNDLSKAGVSLIAISPDFSDPSANPDVPASDLPKYVDMRDLVNQTSGLWIDIKSAEFSAIL